MRKGFWGLPGMLILLAVVFAAGQACTQNGKLKPGTEKWREAENNYDHYCASCHGRDGKGDGMMAGGAPVKPRNHTDAAVMSQRTDEQLFKAIKDGGEAVGLDPTMPPHKTLLKDEEIRGLVKYIRALCNCEYTAP